MSQLVAYYDEKPVEARGRVEIDQARFSSAVESQSVEGAIRTSLVYVRVPRGTGSLLVPFGEYDEWSLRDRYNEALRILNALGASSISCETFGEVTVRRGIRARIGLRGGQLAQKRIENSAYDYRHEGTGSAPRDPRPLRWPDEPGFAAAVTSVLDNGVTEVELNIRNSNTHSIDGSLGIQLKGLGFDLGGQSQRAGVTRLHISANFPQSRKGSK